MKQLVLATQNPGKIRELQDLLAPLGFEVRCAQDYGLAEPVEDGKTFEANALIKAASVFKATNIPSLADDSGLVVACLDGRPGVHSADWMGPHKDPAVAIKRLAQETQFSDHLEASFVTVLVYYTQEHGVHVFKGECHGKLVFPPSGHEGFGFDPVFIPRGDTRTFAQMSPNEKSVFSHRGKALRSFIDFIKKKDKDISNFF